jgi:hypothetical protein
MGNPVWNNQQEVDEKLTGCAKQSPSVIRLNNRCMHNFLVSISCTKYETFIIFPVWGWLKYADWEGHTFRSVQKYGASFDTVYL